LTRVYWTKDGKKLLIDGQRMSTSGLGTIENPVELSSEQSTVLKIKWVQPNDSGVYSCHVLSKGHTPVVSHGAKVEVFGKTDAKFDVNI